MKERHEKIEKVEKSGPGRIEKSEEFRSEGPGGKVHESEREVIRKEEGFGEPVTTTRESSRTERES